MHLRFAAIAVALAAASVPAGAITLYTQDFENPDGFVNDGGDINIFRTINQLYSNQPPGFVFAQTFTTETLLVGGTQAFGEGYSDPDGRAGRYVVGQLSDRQNDLLGLAFDVGDNQFLNFRIDISGIDLDRFGGPFVPANGFAPTFRFSLLDNPSGNPGTSGTVLDFVDVQAPFNSSKRIFNWGTANLGLDASGSTNGNVIFLIDILDGGYAAFDNIKITADDQGGGVPGIPEPATWALMIAGFGLVGIAARRRRAARA
jgi:hypothetical protein